MLTQGQALAIAASAYEAAAELAGATLPAHRDLGRALYRLGQALEANEQSIGGIDLTPYLLTHHTTTQEALMPSHRKATPPRRRDRITVPLRLLWTYCTAALWLR